MKNLIFLVLATMIAATLSSCNNSASENAGSHVMVMVDKTEPIPTRESIIPTEALMQLVGDIGTIDFKEINAVSLNPDTSISFSLADAPNEMYAKKDRDKFILKVNEFREKFLVAVKKGTKKSSIYQPICQAVHSMAKFDPSAKKTIIVCSDMIENSAYGDFYHQSADRIQKVEEGLKASGDSLVKVPNLTVIVLYNPGGSIKKQAQFDRAIGIWNVLGKNKFTLRVAANL